MASLLDKLQLLRGLASGEVAYGGPRWVTLDVTQRCNNICLGCKFHGAPDRSPVSGDQGPRMLPEALVRRICAQLPGAGTSELVLAGEGEPFLHPRLFDFIADFKQAGFSVQLFTNGTLLDETRVRSLIDSGLDSLNVSFWAIDEREHRAWHPGVSLEHLDRRVEGVGRLNRARKLRRRGPRVNLQFPLTRVNFRQVAQRVDLARRIGCDALTFGFFRDWVGAQAEQGLLPEDIAMIRGDLLGAKRVIEAEGIAHNIDQYLAHGQWGHRTWTRLPCYAGWFQSDIKADGTVNVCGQCSDVMGNLLEQDFEQLWNDAPYRRFRRRSSSVEGLASLGSTCDCANCCLVKDNLRVHRIYRHLAPVRDRVGRLLGARARRTELR